MKLTAPGPIEVQINSKARTLTIVSERQALLFLTDVPAVIVHHDAHGTSFFADLERASPAQH